MTKDYLVVYEWTGKDWSAYSPDVPGCAATRKTREEFECNYREALEFHFEGPRSSGLGIPEPHAKAGRIAVAA